MWSQMHLAIAIVVQIDRKQRQSSLALSALSANSQDMNSRAKSTGSAGLFLNQLRFKSIPRNIEPAHPTEYTILVGHRHQAEARPLQKFIGFLLAAGQELHHSIEKPGTTGFPRVSSAAEKKPGETRLDFPIRRFPAPGPRR